MPLERKWIEPNIGYGFRMSLIFPVLKDKDAWVYINKFFGQLMYVVSALVFIISFVGDKINLFPNSDYYLSLFLFLLGNTLTLIKAKKLNDHFNRPHSL
jgi:hypothetical protein